MTLFVKYTSEKRCLSLLSKDLQSSAASLSSNAHCIDKVYLIGQDLPGIVHLLNEPKRTGRMLLFAAPFP